jgi:hypothetical protein
MTQGLKTILNFGAYIGLADFIVFLILFLSGFNPLGPASWLGAAFPVLLMIYGAKIYRLHCTDGYMTYGKAFSTILSIGIAGACLFGILVYMFGVLVDSSIVEMKINETVEVFEKLRGMMGDDWYEKNVAELAGDIHNKMTVSSIVRDDVTSKFLGALLVAFIASFFVRKPKPFFEEPMK